MLIKEENEFVNNVDCKKCKKGNVSGATSCEHCGKPIGFLVK